MYPFYVTSVEAALTSEAKFTEKGRVNCCQQSCCKSTLQNVYEKWHYALNAVLQTCRAIPVLRKNGIITPSCRYTPLLIITVLAP